MKNTMQLFVLAALAVTFLFSSCAKDNSVTSNHSIQKRKYQSGYHFPSKKNYKTTDFQKDEEANALAIQSEDRPQEHYQIIVGQDSKPCPFIESKPSVQPNLQTLDLASSEKTIHSTQPILPPSFTNKEAKMKSLADKKTSFSQITALKKMAKEVRKNKTSGYVEPILFIILCFVLPPVAVGLATDWETSPVIISILLTMLCGLPGIIHAFIVCSEEGVI
jgi:uncharacterized membrane protein YqaE (UPF0057 family)